MRRLRGLSNRHRRGVSIIYMAVVGMAILGIVGLALDTARVYLVAHELQNAADASALAGAQYVMTDSVQSRSQAIFLASQNRAEGVPISVQDNPANADDGQVVIGHWSRSTRKFTATLTNPNAVKVRARRAQDNGAAVPLIFGTWFGSSFSDVERSAIAMLGNRNPGVIVMNNTEPKSLLFDGKGTAPKIVVNLLESPGELGSVIVNSSDREGFYSNGRATMLVQDVYLGGPQAPSNVGLPSTANVHLNEDPTPDPLKPFYTSPPLKPAQKAQFNGIYWQEGYYDNGIPSNAKLGPGLHYVVNGGINGTVTADQGSLIFIEKGDIELKGGDILTVKRITDPNSPYKMWTDLGISIWINQGNLIMNGTPDVNNDGVLYLTGSYPNGKATISGTPRSMGSMLITDRLEFNGTGTIIINLAPQPPKFLHVYLVQ